jgi:hypothetical protein
MTRDLGNILSVFEGSDAHVTIALYEDLRAIGGMGLVGMELFRAQKSSSRAKVYRGGGFRGKAYDKKQWAMGNLCQALAASSGALRWGWKIDEAADFHKWVLYVDLPNGQVSFHTGERGEGPDYPSDWDGVKNASVTRICRFIADLFANANADSADTPGSARSEHEGRGVDLTLQGAAALTPSECAS